MSRDDGFDDRPPVPKKSSGCLKWFLILAGIGGVMSLVCCGVTGYMFYLFKPTIAETDPDVRTLAAEIADLRIPADFRGKLGIKMDNSLMAMRVCSFEHKDGRGVLQLSEMKVKVGDPQKQEADLKQQMRQQGAAELRTLNIESSETREITIRGQPVSFTFAVGQDSSTSTKYHEVQGQFQGKNGLATLHLQVEDEVWDETAIVEMLEAAK